MGRLLLSQFLLKPSEVTMATDPTKNSHDEEPMEEVSGTKIGHGKAPFALVILYLIILVWAVLAWIRPSGT